MTDKFRNKYRIEPNRLQTGDYSAPGAYFLTICVHQRKRILGNIINGRVMFSAAGHIVAYHLIKIPEYHPRAILDEWVVMPDHIHCIIILGGYGFDNGILKRVVRLNNGDGFSGNDGSDGNDGSVEKIHEFSLPIRPIRPIRSTPQTRDDIIEYRKKRRQMLIPKIIGKFKMLSSQDINIICQTRGKKNWQHSYHDRIIRNKYELGRIRRYIINNPGNWERNKNKPDGLWV